ncbi:MAG TPA: c-type cytochrome domain-containing protein [Chitinophagales bacterium]|nr:c-type cytochrome domain-containing protein [Chitinophagales bacterium]
MMKRWAVPVGLFCLAVIGSCSKDQANKQNCGSCPTVSFKADIIPVFMQNCALSGCHDAVTHEQNLDLDSAVAYVNATRSGTGWVKPSDPANSILLSQLYAGSNNHMPVGGQLDDCTIQKVSCWISQGALNN